ncbi:galactose-1-epimerase [Vibrio hannami]|uniref:galactose-1-epimerase n=1 Tax=Vibrio hannami TaxID=2717094 RepID=UPI00240F5177|nr:galactose-1-epimerase [Vibrio hannami]MDG3087344.1 galactose-1-epimerase [Vibrio hannami]
MADTLEKTDSLEKTMTSEAAFDGRPAILVTLKNASGMSVTFMDIGATWLSCKVPVAGDEREVLLGVSTMADFNRQAAYMGVSVGRYANRIAKGQFDIGGNLYQVETNQAGNTLHGGPNGFDKRRWKIAEQGSDFVRYSLVSPDGDQGFPGEVTVSVTYQLTADNRVSICYEAETDTLTPVNLTNHAYFNLLGAESGHTCKEHIVELNALHYLPTNEVGIPLGELAPVFNTSFDFRKAKAISDDLLSDEQQENAKGYDHSFWLDPERDIADSTATVALPDGSLKMKVFTGKPAIQLYTGNWLGGTPNRVGGEYQDYSGVALETQFLPDSPNHPEWAQESSILEPGEKYSYTTDYQFEF